MVHFFVGMLVVGAPVFAGGQVRVDADVVSDWRYVVPDRGAPFEHAPFVSARLTDRQPDDVRVAVEHRGLRRHYAQIRYGAPESVRVAVMVVEHGKGRFDWYVDLNRDRVIDPKERLDGTGNSCRTSLDVEVSDGETSERVRRQVVLRRGAVGSTLAFATVGFIEGSVALAGRTVRVRRVDADGNGLFADARDRIWVDLDGDGQWDPFAEQWSFMPILVLGQRRYAARADALGNRLNLGEIVGSGTIRFTVKPLLPEARVRSFAATLVGDDGSVLALRDATQATSVPVGRYAVRNVTLALEHPATRMTWQFTFSWGAPPGADQWRAVAKDQELVCDPIGKLSFALDCPDADAGVAAGEAVSATPRLITQDGLWINACHYGSTAEPTDETRHHAAVLLQTTDGRAVASATSGFS